MRMVLANWVMASAGLPVAYIARAEVVVAFGEAGIEAEGFAEFGDGFRRMVLPEEGVADVAVGFGQIGSMRSASRDSARAFADSALVEVKFGEVIVGEKRSRGCRQWWRAQRVSGSVVDSRPVPTSAPRAWPGAWRGGGVARVRAGRMVWRRHVFEAGGDQGDGPDAGQVLVMVRDKGVPEGVEHEETEDRAKGCDEEGEGNGDAPAAEARATNAAAQRMASATSHPHAAGGASGGS